jgi:hypothetical protein
MEVRADQEHVPWVFQEMGQVRVEICSVLLHIIRYKPIALTLWAKMRDFCAWCNDV